MGLGAGLDGRPQWRGEAADCCEYCAGYLLGAQGDKFFEPIYWKVVNVVDLLLIPFEAHGDKFC